jgi:gamma-glutamyltranspeptidase / glutathione hydrolase
MILKYKYIKQIFSWALIPFIAAILALFLFSCVSSRNRTFPEDGRFGAYYALPDRFGWNDEVWIEIEDGEVSSAFYQRRSAFGDVAVLETEKMPEELHDKALAAAGEGDYGFHVLPRSMVYRQESFEPDSRGRILRFSLDVEADGEGSFLSVPGFSLVEGKESFLLDPSEAVGLEREELISAINNAKIMDLPLTGEDAEAWRALMLRTKALTRVQEPGFEVPQSPLDPEQGGEAGVVSSHFLATDAGLEIMKAGGNAADAAVAVAAALSVVEPWFSSALGGGTWALFYDARTGEVYSQDGVGPVASRNSADYYAPRAGANGLHQSIVPGAWGGWMEWLIQFGTLPLDRILEPAIALAEDGFPASPALINWLRIDRDNIMERPETAETWLEDGEIPAVEEILRLPDLADTFRRLSEVYKRFEPELGHRGALSAAGDYYYRGPLAERIMLFSEREDGPFELSDFTGFYGEIVEPITIDYKGLKVYQNPPNSQGITTLMALNILKDWDFSGFSGPDDPDAVHLLIEAIKLAHIDKYYHVGDPEWVDVPVQDLLSDSHAAARRAQISMNEVLQWPVANLLPVDPDYSHTTTFQIVDPMGNAVSTTTSLGAQFYVVGDTGIHINNRMRMLSVREGDPNLTVPGKKVRHTSNPYMALLDGKPYILGGNTGVDTQPQGQVLQFIWVEEFGLSPQEAVSRPRFVTRGFPAAQWPWQADNDVGMEEGTPRELIDALASRGHEVVSSGIFGNANMIVIDPENGSLDFGADPRGGVNKGITLSEYVSGD